MQHLQALPSTGRKRSVCASCRVHLLLQRHRLRRAAAACVLWRRPDGSITPEVLYCAKKAGVTHVLKAGGAQAVAAMAWGTASCPKVTDCRELRGAAWTHLSACSHARMPVARVCWMLWACAWTQATRASRFVFKLPLIPHDWMDPCNHHGPAELNDGT